MGGGGRAEEEDLEPRRGFQVRVDLRCLGAMCSLSERERRKIEHNHDRLQIERKERVRMHEHVTCKKDCIMG